MCHIRSTVLPRDRKPPCASSRASAGNERQWALVQRVAKEGTGVAGGRVRPEPRPARHARSTHPLALVEGEVGAEGWAAAAARLVSALLGRGGGSARLEGCSIQLQQVPPPQPGPRQTDPLRPAEGARARSSLPRTPHPVPKRPDPTDDPGTMRWTSKHISPRSCCRPDHPPRSPSCRRPNPPHGPIPTPSSRPPALLPAAETS